MFRSANGFYIGKTFPVFLSDDQGYRRICDQPDNRKPCEGNRFFKFAEMHLTKLAADKVKAPLIKESPVRIECRVTQELELGSHVMFIAKVESVSVDDAYMDEKNTFHLSKAKPIVYSHGEYYSLDQVLGTFGYSVRKNHKKRSTGAKKSGEKSTKKE